MTRPRNLEPAIGLIKAFEGLPDGDPSTVNLDAYLCPAGYWTVGWGHLVRGPDGRPIMGRERRAQARAVYPEGITRAEAEVLLRDDVRVKTQAVLAAVRVPLTDHQLGALVSWAFNCRGWASSTLVRVLNAGRYADVPAQLRRWVYARDPRTGEQRTLRGLVRRRDAEVQLWNTP